MTAVVLSVDEQNKYRRKIEAASMPEPNSGCWIWLLAMNNRGYGMSRLRDGRSSVGAHRLSYAAWKGPIPARTFVLHSCDNPACVNPDHLSIGDHWDNVRDMHTRGRHSHGERNAMSKLTALDVGAIRADSSSTCRALAKAYGVSVSTISDIQIGRQWALAPGIVRRKQIEGEDRRDAKLTAAKVRAIMADGRTQRIIAAEYKVSREAISRIKRGLVWKKITQGEDHGRS